jgi:dihydroneopterin aldolase
VSVEFEPYPAPEPTLAMDVGLGPYERWDRIEFTGLAAEGIHGVYSQEKVTPQPFVVDVRMFIDSAAAAASDDLEDTVDYATVASVVGRAVQKRSYALIEKLAVTIAMLVLEVRGPHRAVSVTVHKPQAARSIGVADVAVTVHRHLREGSG